jgi:uncharacterized protein (TIGR02147 family)
MELFEAQDSRTFLRLAIERIQEKNPRFGYAALVRKAGLASRSFPREVVLGKKSLTIDSARKLAQALSLTAELKQLFLLLVDQDKFKKEDKQSDSLSRQIQKLRNRSRQKLDPKNQGSKNIFYENKGWIEVWSSLPVKNQRPEGISLEVISKQSRVPIKQCEKILNEFIERSLIAKNIETNGYCIAQSEHLIIEELGKDLFFKSWFLDSLDVAKKNAVTHFNSDKHLFLNSVFLIRSEDLVPLRKELRDLMTQYVDQNEDPFGDHLARLSVSFF